MLLGTQLPFERVPHTLSHFTLVVIGEETARRLTEAAGAALERTEREAVEHLERAWVAGPAGPPVQQLSTDGAMAPLVGGEWAEVKTLAVGRVELGIQPDGSAGPQTTDLSYFSRLLDAEAFTRLAYGEVHRRGTERAGTVCAVMDGAEWLQHFVDRHRRDAVRILDFPHAAEHLGLAAQAVFGAGTAEASEWLGRQLHELRHGDPEAVLAALRALAPAGRAAPAAAAKVREVLAYLTKRRAQLDYVQFDAAGYPVGSGAVESANKLLMEARLKGSGMHWARANVNPMLALRCALCSGRWAEAWPQIWQGLRRTQAERRRAHRQQRHPPCPPAPPPPASPPPPQRRCARRRPPKGLMVNGRPTADHPWNRPLRHRRSAEPTSTAKL